MRSEGLDDLEAVAMLLRRHGEAMTDCGRRDLVRIASEAVAVIGRDAERLAGGGEAG
jgi:hypothetical protein